MLWINKSYRIRLQWILLNISGTDMFWGVGMGDRRMKIDAIRLPRQHNGHS